MNVLQADLRGDSRTCLSPYGDHLLDVDSLTRDDIAELLATAEQHLLRIRARDAKSSLLYGKAVYTLFFEDSTRTRVSFEQAGKWLGADVINISAASSSVNKGESLLNTTKTLNAIGADVLVIRHPHSGACHYVARHSAASVVNAGDGMHAHPTQALLDLMTLHQELGDLAGKRVAVIGDIVHSRVARSTLIALGIMGAHVAVAGPVTLLPNDWLSPRDASDRSALPFICVEVCDSVEDALMDADAVMALRVQRERQSSGLLPGLDEYSRVWGINEARLSLARDDAPLMHPGPMNEGVEVASDVAHGDRSVITDQVANGVAIRMAVLERYCRGERML